MASLPSLYDSSGSQNVAIDFRDLRLRGSDAHDRFVAILSRLRDECARASHLHAGQHQGGIHEPSMTAWTEACIPLLNLEVDLSGNDIDGARLRLMLHELQRASTHVTVTRLRLETLPCASVGDDAEAAMKALLQYLEATPRSRSYTAPGLSELALGGWQLGPGATSILPHPKHGSLHSVVSACFTMPQLHTINLSGCGLRVSQLTLLAPLLEIPSLRRLDLSRNSFGLGATGQGPHQAAPKISQQGKGATRAPLGSSTLPSLGARSVLGAVAAVPEEFLDTAAGICWQQISADAPGTIPSPAFGLSIPVPAQQFATALAGDTCKITHLFLQSCNMSDAVGAAIATGLASNASMLYVDMSSNAFSPAAAGFLSNLVRYNSCIQELRLGFQPLSAAGTKAILTMLRENTSITVLQLENTFLDGVVPIHAACDTLERGTVIGALDNPAAALTILAALGHDTSAKPRARALPPAPTQTTPQPVPPAIQVGPPTSRSHRGRRISNHSTLTQPKVAPRAKPVAAVLARPSVPLPAPSALAKALGASTGAWCTGGTGVKRGMKMPVMPAFTREDAERKVVDLWRVADRIMESRPVFCQVVLEYPERPRITAGILRALDFADDETEDDGMGWLRSQRDVAVRAHAWNLQRSVWAARPSEADSGDFYDTAGVLARAFESDWANTKLHRVLRNQSERAAVKPLLKMRYHLLREAFKFFAAQGGDAFIVSFAQFTDLRRAMGFGGTGRTAELDMAFFSADSGAQMRGTLGQVDGHAPSSPHSPRSPRSPRGHMSGKRFQGESTGNGEDRASIAGLGGPGLVRHRSFRLTTAADSSVKDVPAPATSRAPSRSGLGGSGPVLTQSNPTNALMRHELLEAFVRLAIAAYRPTTGTAPSATGPRAHGPGSSAAGGRASHQTSHGAHAATSTSSATARSRDGSPLPSARSRSPMTGRRSGTPGQPAGNDPLASGSAEEDLRSSAGSSADESPIVAAIRRAVEDHLVPAVTTLLNIPPESLDDAYSNLFRRNRMYTEVVDDVLRRFEPVIRKAFTTYADETMSQFMQLSGWMRMLTSLGAFDGALHARVEAPREPSVAPLGDPGAPVAAGAASTSNEPLDSAAGPPALGRGPEFKDKDARLLFTYSIMTVVDELHRPAKMSRVSTFDALTFTGFLEALCRLADSPACPADIPWEIRKAAIAAPPPEPATAAAVVMGPSRATAGRVTSDPTKVRATVAQASTAPRRTSNAGSGGAGPTPAHTAAAGDYAARTSAAVLPGTQPAAVSTPVTMTAPSLPDSTVFAPVPPRGRRRSSVALAAAAASGGEPHPAPSNSTQEVVEAHVETPSNFLESRARGGAMASMQGAHSSPVAASAGTPVGTSSKRMDFVKAGGAIVRHAVQKASSKADGTGTAHGGAAAPTRIASSVVSEHAGLSPTAAAGPVAPATSEAPQERHVGGDRGPSGTPPRVPALPLLGLHAQPLAEVERTTAGGDATSHSPTRDKSAVPLPPTASTVPTPNVALRHDAVTPARTDERGELGPGRVVPRLISETDGRPTAIQPRGVAPGPVKPAAPSQVPSGKAAIVARRGSMINAPKPKLREPPLELPARLEILLTHLAFVEGAPLRGIERKYFK